MQKLMQEMKFFLGAMLILLSGFAEAQISTAKKGYEIKVTIKNFKGDTVRLGNIHEDKIYFQKSLVPQNGVVVFKNDTTLQGGIYVIYLSKEQTYFQILLSSDDQHFSIETEGPDYSRNLKIKGSQDNELYIKNMDFYTSMNQRATPYRQVLEKSKDAKDSKDYKDAIAELEKMDKEVREFQKKFVAQYPKTLTASIMKANQPIDLPEIPKLANGRPDSTFAWRYYKQHYFDGFDFADERLVYTDFIKNKLNGYFDGYVIPDPDSMIVAAEYVIHKAKVNKEMYRYITNKILYNFETSKYVCMDRAFVAIADKYYCSKNAPYAPTVLGSEKYLEKICSRANEMRLVRCGELAPNLKLQSLEKDGKVTEQELHKIQAKYTMVFFWDPECGHCGKVSDKLIEYYDNFKKYGLEVFGICTKSADELKRCNEKATEKKMRWTNYADPYYLAKAKMLYDIKTTPGIFLLDKDKKIILKKFEMDDLKRFFEAEEKKAPSSTPSPAPKKGK